MELELKEIPFNIFLKSNGDILSLCFLEYEDDEKPKVRVKIKTVLGKERTLLS